MDAAYDKPREPLDGAGASGAGGRNAVRVLVVEDDGELAEAIAVGLRREQMAVDVAVDGRAGLERALVTDYDVIVLDRDMPGTHGDDVCAQLVGAGCRSRVLMLTAAATIEDRVGGLGLGADDYLPKPFAFAELVARIRALLRRAQPAVPPVLPSLSVATWYSTRPGGRPAGAGGRSSSAPRSSPRSSCCSPLRAGSCRPKNCSNGCGTRPPIRSRRPSKSR